MTTEVFATCGDGVRRLRRKIIQRSNGQIVVAVIDFKGQIRGTARGLKTLKRTELKVERQMMQLLYRDIEFKRASESALHGGGNGEG